MPKAKVTAADIVHALREHHGLTGDGLASAEWSLLTEVPMSMLVERGVNWRYQARTERTIDVLLLRNWGGVKGEQFDRLAIEVKVSKSDYRNETDEKRAPTWANAHRCAYACPPGLIEVADLPPGWGLMWVYPEPITDVSLRHRDYGKRVSWRRGATKHEPTADPVRLLHNIARRASRAEERIRQGDGDPAELARLRLEVDRLHARLANVDRRIARYRNQAREALTRLRAFGEQRCADCVEIVKPDLYRARVSDDFWKHAAKDAEERCRMARSEAARLEREQATGSRYSPLYSYAPPIETVDEREERLRDQEEERALVEEYRALTTDEDLREEHRYG